MLRSHFRGGFLAGFAILAFAGCTGIPRHHEPHPPSPALERFLPYAGQPIDQFTWLGRFDSWEPLDRNHLVVWTSFDSAYLLTVQTPCIDLPFAHRIGLTSTAGTVSSRFDSVVFRHQNCPIVEMRPLDYRAMERALRKKGSEN